MKMKLLTLDKIVDVAYWCGRLSTPVSIIIAAPPGAGKTWSTKSISGVNRVCYVNTSTSPNEHRKLIASNAPRTSLLINDDIGYFLNRKDEYFVTFGMVIDGRISHTMYKTVQTAVMNCSLILCCTTEQFFDNLDSLKASGLYSRIVPIILGLSAETRADYQKSILSGEIRCTSDPKPRKPAPLKRGKPKDSIIHEYDVEPRMIANIRSMSQYLTEAETEELILIAHSRRMEYEV